MNTRAQTLREFQGHRRQVIEVVGPPGLFCFHFSSFLLNDGVFRPCIDLHEGKVKLILGATHFLKD